MVTGEWPTNMIDHDNGIRNDNRWINLKDATDRENQHNSSVNRGKVAGLRFHSKMKKWVVCFKVKGKQKWFGSFAEYDDALKRRDEALFQINQETIWCP